MMPDPQVNVPAVGKVDRKWVMAGLAASAGIVVYAYWRRSQTAETPATEGDQYAAGDEWSPDAYAGAVAPGGETYDPGGVEVAPLTNAEWTQRVIDLLDGAGFERNFAATTVGKYLAGQQLNTAEKLLMQTAIALLGYPPSGAIPIQSAPEPVVPPVSSPLAAPVLSVRRVGGGRYIMTWSKVSDATGYQLRWVVGHRGGAIRTLGPNSFSYTTARPPSKGHLAFEVRSMKGSARSAWKRVTVRAR